MIGKIEGQVIHIGDRFVIVNVLGVGYKLFVPKEVLDQVKKDSNLSLWVYTAVRENSIDLYGFMENEELSFFEMLLGVSGIGPRSALSILDIAPVGVLRKAIAVGDMGYLTKVSGIGRKTAEKIIVELRDKLRGFEDDEFSSETIKEEKDVIEALKSLGYSQNESREAVKAIPHEIKEINERLKEALRILGRG